MWTDRRQDIAYAVRLLGRAPGFTTLAILTLALGVGATTAIFSVVDAALLRPLPYPDPERLVTLTVNSKQSGGRIARLGPSLADMAAWREDGQVFSHLAVWRQVVRPSVLDGREPERVAVREVSQEYLGLHGVLPFLGRGFGTDDTLAGAPPVVLLGHGFWLSRFGGDRDVIDRSVRIDGEPVTIVGVLPPGFYRDSQIWRPHRVTGVLAEIRGSGASVYGRLKPGVTIEQAERRLSALTVAFDLGRRRAPAAGVSVESLREQTTAGYRTTTNILLAAVGSILLIACINVAGLLLARGATRRAELAIRSSIGASRIRILRQLLTESLVLSTLGGVGGLIVAWLSLDALVANLPIALPPNSPVTLNVRVFAFACAISVATGMLFGMLPALTLSKVNVAGALGRGDRRQGSGLSRRSGQLLIAAEVALALVLLTGAGLMLRSFARILSVDVGFDPTRIVTMDVVPIGTDDATLKQFYPALVESLRHLPGVDAVGAVDHMPLAGGSTVTFARADADWISINTRTFVPGYFEALEFVLTDGRLPSASAAARPAATAVINEQAARQLFPGRSAVGRSFALRAGGAPVQVLGVVRDVRHDGPLWPAEPEVYMPFGLDKARPMIVVVRSEAGAAMLNARLREAARGVTPRVVVSSIRQGSDWLDERVATPRRRTVLLSLLGGLGLLLSLIGIFGMTAYAVARRTREIGVRMAFGARQAEIVWTMLRDSIWPVAIGIAVGVGGAIVSTKIIASFLFETSPTEGATLAGVAAVVFLTACLAAWIPARHAAAVDPVAALRAE